MSPLRFTTLLPLVWMLLGGCTSAPTQAVSAPGSAQLAVHLPEALPEEVSRVTVTVSGADMASRATDLTVTHGVWGGVLEDLPAGAHRTFLAQAFDASNTLRFEGRAEDITVTAGVTGLVSLTLQDVSAPVPFTNEAPVVDSLVVGSSTVAPGGSVSLTASVHDPNPGDSVSYAWSAPSGGFSAPTQATTTWSAPAHQGPVRLTLTASDSHGAALSVNLTLTVSAGSGADEVKVDFHATPLQLLSFTSSQSLLDVGQHTSLSVSVAGAPGDALDYQWSATCAGTFTGQGTASATFTPSALPAAACNNCQVSVGVMDGQGGQNTGSLALCVARDTRHAPPVLADSYQSSLTPLPGQELAFQVDATDPAGSALDFTWTANVGTLGTPSTGSTRSRITWKAPGCVTAGLTPSLTATITNAFGLKVTRSFTAPGLPECGTPSWISMGSMATPRYAHTATLLPNGKVLVVGGYDFMASTYLATAELYDPATGGWSPTGSLVTPRFAHTATLLPNGKVLIMGGYNGRSLATAELYDPATGTWSVTGSLYAPRNGHSATLLTTGKVLVTGGYITLTPPLATAELYDPATGTWTRTGSMLQGRYNHTATRLPTGAVLVSGGVGNNYDNVATAEMYDPVSGTWFYTRSMAAPRSEHTGTLLANGKVLVAGGEGFDLNALNTAELYDPATDRWSSTGIMTSPRYYHTMTPLPSGLVLVSGGETANGAAVATAELYDPASGLWKPTASMASPRNVYAATLLPTGQVLVSGGDGNPGIISLATVELYDPNPTP